MSYLDCFVGYPSSVHDERVFRNSDIFAEITSDINLFFPNGEVCFGHKAHPQSNWLVSPFVDRRNLTVAQKRFNKTHADLRSVIERSFALLFGRWRRHRYIDMNRFEWIPAVILSACVLYNICINLKNTSDKFIEEGQQFLENVTRTNNPVPRINLLFLILK